MLTELRYTVPVPVPITGVAWLDGNNDCVELDGCHSLTYWGRYGMMRRMGGNGSGWTGWLFAGSDY